MTIVDWKQIDTSPPSKKDKRNNFLLLLTMIILLGYVIYNVFKRENDLEKTEFTWAVVTDSYSSKNVRYLKVKYHKNNQIIQSNYFVSDKCELDKIIGDTIIINYSTINSKTVEIKECFWNDNVKKKYNFYKW